MRHEVLRGFDEYAAAIRQANVSFVLTKRAETLWKLSYHSGDHVSVQLGCDGGASIADGIAEEDSYVLIGRSRPSPAHILMNGEPIADLDFVLLPPGARFIFAADGPREWLSIALPHALVEEIWLAQPRLRVRIIERRPSMVPLSFELARNIRDAATAFRDRHASGDGSCMRTLGDNLLSLSRTALAEPMVAARAALDGSGVKCLEIVSSALLALHSNEHLDRWYVEELAQVAEAHPRALLRAFRRVLGMGPVHYLT